MQAQAFPQYRHTVVLLRAMLDGAPLELYRDTTLDFEDCVLIARHKIDKYDVVTFDKAMLKHIGSIYVDPHVNGLGNGCGLASTVS